MAVAVAVAVAQASLVDVTDAEAAALADDFAHAREGLGAAT